MQKFRQLPWWVKILSGAAVLFFFCCACGMIGSLSTDLETAEQNANQAVADLVAASTENAADIQDSITEAEADIAAITDTISTDTPVPPTATPEPTTTPVPTNTPRPTATINPENASEQAYIDFVGTTTELYVAAMDLLATQNTAASEDTTLLFDDDWIFTTATAVYGVQEASRQVLEYDGEIPSRFANVHQEYREIAQIYSDAMDAYILGLDNFDGDKLNEATNLITQGTRKLSELTDSLEELQ